MGVQNLNGEAGHHWPHATTVDGPVFIVR